MSKPDVEIVLSVLDEVGTPWLTVTLRCGRCGAEIACHRFDARTDADAAAAATAEAHGAATLAHRCRGH